MPEGMIRAGMPEPEPAQPLETERLIELKPGLHSYPMPDLENRGRRQEVSYLTPEEVQLRLDRFFEEITKQGGRLVQIISVTTDTGVFVSGLRKPLSAETRFAIIDLPIESGIQAI